MTQIEAYNYTIGLDTSRLQAGGIITRRELSQLRRDFRSLQDPADKSRIKIERLTEGLDKGAVQAADYREAVRRIQDSMPAAVAERKRLADVERESQAIRAKLMTEEQQYAQELKRMTALIRDEGLSRAEAVQHLKDFKAELPSVVTERRRLEAAERDAQAIMRDTMSDSAKYRAEVHRVNALVKETGLSQSRARQHLANYRSTLPSVVAAERQRADLMQRGRAMMDRYSTATERHTREIREQRQELERLKRAGTIDAKTYQRGRADLARPSKRGGGLRADLAAAMPLRMAGPAALVAASGYALKASIDAERAQASFEGLAGSAQKAAQLMSGLDQLSTKGLEKSALEQSAGMLLATEMSVKDLIPTLEMFGNIARGDTERMKSLALVMAQVRDQTVMMGGDYRQFLNAGINPLNIMSEQTGKSMNLLKQEMSEGKISAEMVTAALQASVAEGGTFFGQLEKFGETTAGSLATAKAELHSYAKSYGDMANGIIGTSIAKVTGLFSGLRDVMTDANERTGGWLKTLSIIPPLRAMYRDVQEMAAEKIEPKPIQMSVLNDPTVSKEATEEIKSLREKNTLLERGPELVDEYRWAQQGAGEEQLKELRALKERNEQLERTAELERDRKSIAEGAEEELRLAKLTFAFRQQIASLGVDDAATAQQLAELKAAQAGNAELQKHLATRQEILALDERQAALDEQKQKRKQDFEELKNEAEELRKSLRSPMQALADDFSRIDQLQNAQLITRFDAMRAKWKAARDLVELPEDMSTQSLTPDGVYAALVEEQQERRKARIKAAETKRLMDAADQVAAREQKRLTINDAITRQMAAQAKLSGQIMSGPPQAAGGTREPAYQDDRTLERIAEASEATASAIGKWEMVTI